MEAAAGALLKGCHCEVSVPINIEYHLDPHLSRFGAPWQHIEDEVAQILVIARFWVIALEESQGELGLVLHRCGEEVLS